MAEFILSYSVNVMYMLHFNTLITPFNILLDNIHAHHNQYFSKGNDWLIMSMGWDYISELWLPTDLLLIPQVICEHG
jgi:hypothetical protein